MGFYISNKACARGQMSKSMLLKWALEVLYFVIPQNMQWNIDQSVRVYCYVLRQCQ